MSQRPDLGDFVTHSTRGLGKVVSKDSTEVRVYFRDLSEGLPEDQVKVFPEKSFGFLSIVDPFPDLVLDNLPPWKDGRFVRYRTDLTIDSAKKIFLRLFPGGIGDPLFVARECAYKRSAHSRYVADFAPNARAWIAAMDASAIADSLDRVYGDPKGRDGADERLNLLYQRVEEPAFFEALRNGGDHTVCFAEAALNFIEQGGDDRLNSYIRALGQLPPREGGASLEHWTTLTWLPFIAAPHQHILVKPTIIQSFASALAFEANYSPRLNPLTYATVQDLGHRLRETLRSSEINLRGREIDLIDVQSFMWVVARYNSRDAVEIHAADGDEDVSTLEQLS